MGITALYAVVSLTGLSAIINAFIPEATVLPILVFVGISSYTQAFNVVKRKYFPAVVMASLPLVIDFISDNVAEGSLAGFSAFTDGSAFIGLVVGCIFVFIIDNAWLKASIANLAGLALTGIGMMHSPGVLFTDTYAPDLGFIAVYAICAVVFLALHFLKFNQKSYEASLAEEGAQEKAELEAQLAAYKE